MFNSRPAVLVIFGAALILLSSCYREEIQFTGDPPESHTSIVRIDTITPQVSTVITDSFVTGNASSFLLGEYSDPHLGTITARAFMQISSPQGDISVPEHAVYDSLVMMVRLNKYYYGDTMAATTLQVHELDETIVPGYNEQLYNTSNFSIKPAAMGSRQAVLRPHIDTTVVIRLNDAKGMELFSKLKQKADEVTSSENFLNYFKGIRLSAAGTANGPVYGLDGSADTIRLRLHYHTTVPYPEEQYIDFPRLSNALSFKQLLVSRNGTLPDPIVAGRSEFPASMTGNLAFTQPGAGVLMKVVFPSLRNILSTDVPLNLLHAELYIRPLKQSYATFALPPALTLAQTDGSNFIGNFLADSTGQSVLYGTPVIDALYGVNNYYRFNVTYYINQLLHTPASGGIGFYLLEYTPQSATGLHRGIFGDGMHPESKMQLVISVLTVNTN